MNLSDIHGKIIAPALIEIGAFSTAAEQLVMATGMAESLYKHDRQIARYENGQPVYGPALGFWQMEPATHNDIWRNYLGFTRRQGLVDGLRRLSKRVDPEALVLSPQYAAAMCRIHYLRVPAPLPQAGDWRGMAEYWKRYYNTPLGKGTVDGFLQKIAPVIKFYGG